LIKQASYIHFIRISVLLVLLGLSLDNVFSYTFLDVDHTEFELFDPFDTEGEKEGETEEEKEDKEDEKIEVNPFATDSAFDQFLMDILPSLKLASIPHPDISTPPPKAC